jgi:hypothetical protein
MFLGMGCAASGYGGRRCFLASNLNSSDRSFLGRTKSKRFSSKFLATFQGLSQSKLLSGGLGPRTRCSSTTPLFFRGFPRHWSRPCHNRLAFPRNGFGSGLAKNSGQLKNAVESPVSKPLIGLMVCNIVVTNQQIHIILNVRHKLSLRFPFPDSGGDLRHRHHHLRQGRFFRLHPETKLFTKRPQAASKKFFYHIATPDERSRLNKSRKISVLRTAKKRNFRHF